MQTKFNQTQETNNFMFKLLRTFIITIILFMCFMGRGQSFKANFSTKTGTLDSIALNYTIGSNKKIEYKKVTLTEEEKEAKKESDRKLMAKLVKQIEESKGYDYDSRRFENMVRESSIKDQGAVYQMRSNYYEGLYRSIQFSK